MYKDQDAHVVQLVHLVQLAHLVQLVHLVQFVQLVHLVHLKHGHHGTNRSPCAPQLDMGTQLPDVFWDQTNQ